MERATLSTPQALASALKAPWRPHRLIPLGAACALASACGLGTGPSITVASVTVSPDSVTLVDSTATQQFSAIAWDSAGEPLPGVSFTWVSSNVLVATVDTNGLVRAKGTGHADIIVEADLASDTASVRVALPTESVVGVRRGGRPD